MPVMMSIYWFKLLNISIHGFYLHNILYIATPNTEYKWRKTLLALYSGLEEKNVEYNLDHTGAKSWSYLAPNYDKWLEIWIKTDNNWQSVISAANIFIKP